VFGPPVISIEKMVAHPERVEADVLGSPVHGRILGPTNQSFDLGKMNTDPKWTHGCDRLLAWHHVRRARTQS
jgi:hypothetical protein